MTEDIRLRRLLIGVHGIFVCLWTLSLAVPALAVDPAFDCCLCKSTNPAKEFCTLTLKGTTCDSVADKINTQTEKKFSVACSNLDAGNCAKVASGSSGKCTNEPAASDKFDKSFFASAKPTENYVTSVAPVLGVPIPGVTFPDKLEVANNMVQVPYLAIYITAFQKYLIGISLVVAAMMLVYGGLRYIWGGTGASIETAKSVIQDALIGLVLVMFAAVLLANINPNATSFGSLKVPLVQVKGTPIDVAAGKQMVRDSAQMPDDSTASIIDAINEQEAVAARRTAKYGATALNAKGLPVAQDRCPEDMIAMPYSDTYTNKTKSEGNKTGSVVDSFCMDRFEAPNRRGVKPYNGVHGIEAAWWCDQYDKRLCTMSEWTRACLGPDADRPFGYDAEALGYKKDEFVPGHWMGKNMSGPKAPCNYDTTDAEFAKLIGQRDKIISQFYYYPTQRDGSFLSPESQNTSLANPEYRVAYYIYKDFINAISKAEPSGSRLNCVTKEGVYDMLGNVQEIVIRDSHAKDTIDDLEGLDGSTVGDAVPFGWMNFYWSSVAHQGEGGSAVGSLPYCTRSWGSTGHALGWRAFENGFRCCMDLDTDRERARRTAAEEQARAKAGEDRAKQKAQKEKLDVCGTTPLTQGMTCMVLSTSMKVGTTPGKYTCQIGYCKAPGQGAHKCCVKNE
jgi:formylglycine-generating enzyme required for sulfatase activity